MICCILNGCTEPPLPTVHEQLRQHILEAELGSSITISFAKGIKGIITVDYK